MTTDEFVDLRSSTDEPTRVAPGLAYLRDRIVNVAFIDAYPIWSIMMIALDVVVIMALTVHGSEIKNV